MLVEAMRVDPRLGAALGAFIRDGHGYDEFRADNLSNSAIFTEIEDRERALALRMHLLADAFQVASRALSAVGDVPLGPLLQRRALVASPGEAEANEENLGWVRLVMQAHEWPSRRS